jgi:hypothetical protein
MRTTVDIDDPVLKQLKRLSRDEGKSLGRVISDLLGRALAQRPKEKTSAFNWRSRDMGALVDLGDRDAVLDAMDEPRR